MLTKKVENGLQQNVYNKLYQIYIYIKKTTYSKNVYDIT